MARNRLGRGTDQHELLVVSRTPSQAIRPATALAEIPGAATLPPVAAPFFCAHPEITAKKPSENLREKSPPIISRQSGASFGRLHQPVAVPASPRLPHLSYTNDKKICHKTISKRTLCALVDDRDPWRLKTLCVAPASIEVLKTPIQSNAAP